MDPSTTEADEAACLQMRTSPVGPTAAAITDAYLLQNNLDVVHGLIEESDEELAHELVEKVKEKRPEERASAVAGALPPVTLAEASQTAVPPAARAADSAPARQTAVSQKRFPFEVSETSLEEARQYAPPGVSLYKDLQRHMRWSAEMKDRPVAPRFSTKAWGERTRLADQQALLFLLGTTWAWHSEKTGEACPFVCSFEVFQLF